MLKSRRNMVIWLSIIKMNHTDCVLRAIWIEISIIQPMATADNRRKGQALDFKHNKTKQY